MTATSRATLLASHLGSRRAPNGLGANDDVVIVAAVRTPITRAKRGGFKDLYPEDMLAAVLKAVIARSRIDPARVSDVCVGCVLPPGGGATIARMAALHAGLPESTALSTVNRQCSSGLQAVANIANGIRARMYDFGIGAGMESMTRHYPHAAMPDGISDTVSASPNAAGDCMLSMGITSENVAKEYNVSRARQDAFAARSHARAAAAQAAGLFDAEIVPVAGISRDDGVRADTTPERLAKLRPAFADDGSTTAGNASQVSDGAAAVLLARRSAAVALGLPILARFVSFAVVGVPPRIMGVGPAYAIPRALDIAGIGLKDVDIIELNEAFASQALMVIDKLRLPEEKVNPKGGAIALGHPLGCTGARQIATLLPELKRANKRIGVVSMCIGTGMGAAAVIVRE